VGGARWYIGASASLPVVRRGFANAITFLSVRDAGVRRRRKIL
jgi:hypothetical protein